VVWRVGRSRAAGEECKAVVQPRQQLLRCSQVDCQRQPVQASADLAHQRHVDVGKREAGRDSMCPLDEQANGGVALLCLRSCYWALRIVGARWEGERWDAVAMLAREFEVDTACNQQLEVWRCRQQLGEI
jgi:hypothetical protein